MLDGFGVDDLCDSGRGQVLAPWPNRLGDGSYSYEGQEGRAALDEPDRHNAIHGLVRWLPWQLVSRAQNVLNLGCTLHPQPGYRWRLWLSIEYRLGRDGLTVTTTATNLDRSAGTLRHRLPPLPDAVDTDRLDVARHPGPASARHRRTGTAHLDEPGERVRASTSTRRVGSATPCSTPPSPTSAVTPTGWHASSSTTPPAARGVTVWMDEHFGYVMVFTGDTLEPTTRRRASIAVEPMSCPPDALRSGVDLVRLEPGASWSGRWGINPR